MCRHLAYVGPVVRLGALIVDPPFALERQADSPRHQDDGVDNVDGFGVAWYDAPRVAPHRHRKAVSVTKDPALAELAALTGTAVLAAIRNASEGIDLRETNTAPYTSGQWAFSHNGFVKDFVHVSADGAARWGTVRDRIADLLPSRRRDCVEGTTDSEMLFALCLAAIDAGTDPAGALVRTIHTVADLSGHEDSRLNLLLTDGDSIHATRWGNSLFALQSGKGEPASVVVASEPYDDDPNWTEVPDRCVLVATPDSITIGEIG